MRVTIILIAGVAFLVSASPLQAQQRRQPARAAGVPLEIKLQVDGKSYRAEGRGECKTADDGSVHGVRATLYTASHGRGSESLRLIFWQPKSGADNMMSLHVSLGGSNYDIDTVRVGTKHDAKGFGRVSLQKTGAGGTFALEGTTSSGAKISGTIHCGRFAPILAQGG